MLRIGLFCPNWVGDAVMATPALRAIREQYPNAHLTAVLRPYVRDVLSGLNLVDDFLLHDPRRGVAGFRSWAFARVLRRHHFDWVVLFPNSFRSAWWSWISGAPRRVGFARDGRSWMLTDALTPKSRTEPNPVIDEYLRLAKHLGCRKLDRRMELATTATDEQQLASFWSRQRLGSSKGTGYICLNPGGAFGAAKHWPITSFAELARRIATELGRRVLVLCGPEEREEARSIVRWAEHPHVFSLTDEPPSLGLTKAAVRHAELMVSTDSGPRHFAQPFGVPVVTLFGPTHAAWSETYHDMSRHLQVDVDCGPCQRRVCPLGHHRCMKDLKVSWVFKAVATLLDESRQRRVA